nr:MAG TPA: Microcompartments protein [Caudoviricetes sp.]DAS11443.1 MAG TPA: Microcompartments protein [Caudoviricetes sp.]
MTLCESLSDRFQVYENESYSHPQEGMRRVLRRKTRTGMRHGRR